MDKYIPEKGDFVVVNFDPQSGHEQKGRRHAMVISNKIFNNRTGLCIVCPITNTNRSFPFHVEIPQTSSLIIDLKPNPQYSTSLKVTHLDCIFVIQF